MKHECSICKMKADYKEREDDRWRYYCVSCLEENCIGNFERLEE